MDDLDTPPSSFFNEVIPRLTLIGLDLMPTVDEAEYHNQNHAQSVALTAQRLLREDERDFSEYEYSVIQVASYFHDSGHSNGPSDGHEERSCSLFREACDGLREEGYDIPQEFEEDVCRVILGTIFLDEPDMYLARILSDADVWNFGSPWDTFYRITVDVRDEFAPNADIEDWFGSRAYIMKQHVYYTEVGRRLFAKGKQENIERIEDEFGIVEEFLWDDN